VLEAAQEKAEAALRGKGSDILDGHPQSRIEDLMPWCFNQPSSLAA
jgi:hypothetical protein